MPQRRNAIKALRQNRQRHLANQDFQTGLKKTVKKFKQVLAQKNKEEAKTLLKAVHKKIDKATKRNLLHKNTAARRKSVFSRLLLNLA